MDISDDDRREFYKIVPSILKDIESKEENFDFGVYTIDIGLNNKNKRLTLRVIVMPEYKGILDDNDELIYVFS